MSMTTNDIIDKTSKRNARTFQNCNMIRFEIQAVDKLTNKSPYRVSLKKTMAAITDKKCGIETNRHESAERKNFNTGVNILTHVSLCKESLNLFLEL